jgi:hypothetical protein
LIQTAQAPLPEVPIDSIGIFFHRQ